MEGSGMCAEYPWLQDAASTVDQESVGLRKGCRMRSASELAAVERRLDALGVQRAPLAKALIVLCQCGRSGVS